LFKCGLQTYIYFTTGGLFCLLEAKATGNSPAQQVVYFYCHTMKKLLSIMLAVMMVASLFAINASAAVSHGATSHVIGFQDFSDVESNTFMAISGYGDADTNVVDGAMKVTFAQEDASYSQIKATASQVDFTQLPDVFYLDFDVKVVNASLPIIIGFCLPTKDEEGNAVDGRIGARIFPACFNPEITKTSAYKTDSTLYDINKSFSFRVVVDQSKYYADRENLISNNLGDNLYDVIKIYKREEGGFYNAMAKYNTGGNFVYTTGYRTGSAGGVVTLNYTNDAIGIIVNKAADDSSFAANTEYIFDNIKLSWEESIPTKGVISYQDYEGTLTVSTSASYGVGTPMVSEDGNHFLKLTTVNDGKNTNALIVPADNADFTKDDVTVTFDVCAKKPGAINVEVYGKTDNISVNDQETMAFIRTDEAIEVDKWYRVKFSFGGDITNKVAVKNLTDGGDWEVLKYASNGSQSEANKEFGVGGCGSSASGRIRICSDYDSRRQPEGADPTDVEWWIDNIMITNTEAISFPAVNVTDEEIAVTVDFEDGAVLKAETMKAVLAVYDEAGRLVDVSMDAKAAAAGEISGAKLSVDAASYTENGEIKLLVWDGGETAAPILSEAYDISALLK